MRVLFVASGEETRSVKSRICAELRHCGHDVLVISERKGTCAKDRKFVFDAAFWLWSTREFGPSPREAFGDSRRYHGAIILGKAGSSSRARLIRDRGDRDYVATEYLRGYVIAARIRELRNAQPRHGGIFSLGNLTLNTWWREVHVNDVYVSLPYKEYLLCEYLVRHARQIVRYEDLKDFFRYGYREDIQHLRQTLNRVGWTGRIAVLTRVGYRMFGPPET